MSLELALQANTAAIQQLTAMLMSGKFMSADGLKDVMTVGHVSGDEEGSEKKAAQERISELEAQKYQEVKTELLKMQEASQAASRPAEEAKVDVPVTEHVTQYDKPLTYEVDVLPVLHKFLVAKGKLAAESLLKKYAVDKFSKVPATQLGDLLADINEAMRA
jgi:hypothetical protein